MKPLLAVLLVIISIGCYSQQNRDSLYFATMKSHVLSLPPVSNNLTYNLPFSHIEVLDVRPDTTSIGFSKNGKIDYLIFDKNLSSSLTEYIIDHYSLSKDSNDLLILVKKFRLTNYAKIKEVKDDNTTQWSGGCLVSAELFLKNNYSYHALYKVDSLLIESSANETITDLIDESFKIILKKCENKNLSEMHIGKTTYSFSDIQKHIADFTNFPIIKNTTLKQGVYKNFEEFKFNTPSINNYTIHKGKYTDEILITENDESYPLQNFWGYCDGKNIFIYSAKNLFKLLRTGNTFNVKGMKSLSDKYNKSVGNEVASSYLIGIPMSAMVKNNYAINATAFQLDMQNGELY